MKPKDKSVRLCKVCKKTLPLIKGDYCDLCRITLEQGGQPPIYVCKECGTLNGEEKQQGGLKEGEATQWHKAKCHVCNKKKEVTHYRKFGYLTKGHLAKKIDKKKIYKKLMPKKS